MFAVVVRFHLKPGTMEDFLPLITQNAKTSLNDEDGCHQFDVLTDPDAPDEVFLYELYSDAAAFETHLASAHFKSFDAAAGDMIATKDVRTYATVRQ